MTEIDPVLSSWSAELAEELDVDPAVVDVDAILALAGRAAHAIVRPAAPVTTYIVGYAAGLRAADPNLSAEDAWGRARELIRLRTADAPQP